MKKATPRQLEFPLLVNLNANNQSSQAKDLRQQIFLLNDASIAKHQSLAASAEDLSIYRSIGESFLKQFK
jgi:hypothetical protein